MAAASRYPDIADHGLIGDLQTVECCGKATRKGQSDGSDR